MYTPPLSFTGVKILVRCKTHGLFPRNGCILELLALAAYTVVMTLCLCCSRKWMWMSFLGWKRVNLMTLELQPTIPLPSLIG